MTVHLDETHLVAAMAYVALNPVRARLVGRAEDWRWSSIHAYRRPGTSDGVTDCHAVAPYIEAAMRIIATGEEDARFMSLRRSESIGRPVGDDDFIRAAEKRTGRALKPAKRGPKPKSGTGKQRER
ncbi:hypothetical protein L2D14_08820 [Thalassospiraceae bacterium LMO-JJ14]|nr:hypothetical protein L2D14_08820 [Thalassospiraceae bacterium LMO-JJ14]